MAAMPAWFVAVELPTRDTTQQESAALIAACTSALGDGRCELSDNSVESARAIAIVSFRGPERLGALIEVGQREAPARAWRSQEIAFKPEDARVERFRTLGLAIATLVRETEIEANQGSRPAPPEAAPPRTETRRAEQADSAPSSVRESQSSVWLGAGALVGFDHDLPSSVRYGGRIAAGFAPRALPFFASFSGSYAIGRAPGDGGDVAHVSLAWATLAPGLGVRLALPADIEARAGIQAVVLDLLAHASEGGREQEGQRWVFGGQLELELSALRSRRFGFTMGGALQHLSGATQLVIHDQSVGTSAAFSWSVHAAFELRPFR